ncbi:MAG TPA: hypothetical protein VEN30_31855, partial [Paraburkholderia sp.]|nr:hypothetical protein [Paraburkholderia sp.]
MAMDGGGGVPPKPPPPPTAHDVSTAQQAVQKALGDKSPGDASALKDAVKKAEEADAQLTREALARAVILMQAQYNAAHQHAPKAQEPKVDAITEAASQVGLAHAFDNATLEAAAKSLSDSPLVVDNSAGSAPASAADARVAIQKGLDGGMTLPEAVNAARVQLGGNEQNETALDEAALAIKGDQIVADPKSKGGDDPLKTAQQQLADLKIFTSPVQQAAVKALTVDVKPTAGLPAAAKDAQSAYATLQKDTASHASAQQIAQDEAAYHEALSNELNTAAGETGDDWRGDLLQIDRRWQAEQAVTDANTAKGVAGASSDADVRNALKATEILDAAEAARGSGDAAGNLKAAQSLTRSLQGLKTDDPLYAEVTGDARAKALQAAALQDIESAHGGSATDTLKAEGNALSGYRNTVLYNDLLNSTLSSTVTQHNIQQAGTPDNLRDIANLLTSVKQASPELAAALYKQNLQGKIDSLIKNGAQIDTPTMSQTIEDRDKFYGPLGNIVDALGGPKSADAQPVMQALKTQLNAQLNEIERLKNAGANYAQTSFDTVSFARVDGSSLAAYQALIDEDPNSALAKKLEAPLELKPSPAPVKDAPQDAQQLAKAQQALSTQLGNGPVDQQSLDKALTEGRKSNPEITDATWAQAALLQKAQADGRKWATDNAGKLKAGTKVDTIDPVAQASDELSKMQLFDARTLSGATDAVQGGNVAAAPDAPLKKGDPTPGPISASDYLSQLLNEGMSMKAAIVATRAYLGGRASDDYTIAQAALTAQAQTPANLKAFYQDPTNKDNDPIRAASRDLAKLGVLPADVLDTVTQGMAQDPKPDEKALKSAAGKANDDYQKYRKAQADLARDKDNPTLKEAAAKALQTYHDDLGVALNAAAGRKPDDSFWQTDPNYVDTMWKAQFALEREMLAPQIEAAQYTGDDSTQSKALDAAFNQLQTALGAQQVIQQARYARQENGGADKGDVAAAQALSRQLAGMKKGDPLYDEVMGDATITSLQSDALKSIVDAGAMLPCTPGNSGSDDAKTRFAAEGKQLAAYAGTVFYPQLLDGAVQDPQTQALFSQINSLVRGKDKPEDKLNAVADFMHASTSADFAAALYQAKFAGDVDHDDVLQWTAKADDLDAVSRIYAAGGGAANPRMTQLRQGIEALMKKPLDKGGFGNIDTSSDYNQTVFAAGEVAVVQGQGFGLGDVKDKKDGSMQLAQDMLDDDPNSDVGKEIARETGFKDAGKPVTPIDLNDPKVKLQPGAPWPADSKTTTVLTSGGHVAGLDAQDGMQVLTSYDAVLNAVGAAQSDNGPTRTPGSLEDQQALALGQFAEYDPNEVVYDHDGHQTTLGQIADKLMKGEGVNQPSGLAPVALTSMSMQWWNKREPGKDEAAALQAAVMEGIDAKGNEIEVGPADTTVRHGYSDWQSHTGLDKGLLVAQPHWVLGGSGNLLTDSAYMTTYKPDDHWYDWDHLKVDLEIGVTVAAGLLTTLVQPETAALWLIVLSDLADAYFAVSATIGAAQTLHTMGSTKDGWSNGANWLALGANVFGGVAGVGGLTGRTAKVIARVGMSDRAFADATGFVKLAHNATREEAAAASAANNGARALREFETPPAALRRWVAGSPAARARSLNFFRSVSRATEAPVGLSTDAAALARWSARLTPLERLHLARAVQLLGRVASLRAANRAALAFRGIGVTALTTNLGSLVLQGHQLATSNGAATGEDWAQFASSAGLMGVGFVAARGHSGAQRDADQHARNQAAARNADAEAQANAGARTPQLSPHTIQVDDGVLHTPRLSPTSGEEPVPGGRPAEPADASGSPVLEPTGIFTAEEWAARQRNAQPDGDAAPGGGTWGSEEAGGRQSPLDDGYFDGGERTVIHLTNVDYTQRTVAPNGAGILTTRPQGKAPVWQDGYHDVTGIAAGDHPEFLRPVDTSLVPPGDPLHARGASGVMAPPDHHVVLGHGMSANEMQGPDGLPVKVEDVAAGLAPLLAEGQDVTLYSCYSGSTNADPTRASASAHGRSTSTFAQRLAEQLAQRNQRPVTVWAPPDILLINADGTATVRGSSALTGQVDSSKVLMKAFRAEPAKLSASARTPADPAGEASARTADFEPQAARTAEQAAQQTTQQTAQRPTPQVTDLPLNNPAFDFSPIPDGTYRSVALDSGFVDALTQRPGVLGDVARVTQPGGSVTLRQPSGLLDEPNPRAAIDQTVAEFEAAGLTNVKAEFVTIDGSSVDLRNPGLRLDTLDPEAGVLHFSGEKPAAPATRDEPPRALTAGDARGDTQAPPAPESAVVSDAAPADSSALPATLRDPPVSWSDVEPRSVPHVWGGATDAPMTRARAPADVYLWGVPTRDGAIVNPRSGSAASALDMTVALEDLAQFSYTPGRPVALDGAHSGSDAALLQQFSDLIQAPVYGRLGESDAQGWRRVDPNPARRVARFQIEPDVSGKFSPGGAQPIKLNALELRPVPGSRVVNLLGHATARQYLKVSGFSIAESHGSTPESFAEGNTTAVGPGSRTISPKRFVRELMNDPAYKPGDGVLLTGCYLGSGGFPWARELAYELQAPVIASMTENSTRGTGVLYLHPADEHIAVPANDPQVATRLYLHLPEAPEQDFAPEIHVYQREQAVSPTNAPVHLGEAELTRVFDHPQSEAPSNYVYVDAASLPVETGPASTLQRFLSRVKANRDSVRRGTPVQVALMSDLGYARETAVRFTTADGEQIKPAGVDMYAVAQRDPATGQTTCKLVNIDESGLPEGFAAVHSNGLRAVGMVRGRPVWPVAGAAGQGGARRSAGTTGAKQTAAAKRAARANLEGRVGNPSSMTKAVEQHGLVDERTKQGGLWPGSVMRDTTGKFGSVNGLWLIKQMWKASVAGDTGEARARNAVATSQLMRTMYGEGSATDMRLVTFKEPGTGTLHYGIMTPFAEIDVSSTHAKAVLGDPERSMTNGVFATAAGHIALKNVSVAGNRSSEMPASRETFGNIGLTRGDGEPAAFFIDLDSAMGFDNMGEQTPFTRLTDVAAALDELKNGDETAPAYGSMSDREYRRSVDLLKDQLDNHGLEEKIFAVMKEHGEGNLTQRKRAARVVIANIKAQVAAREKAAPYTREAFAPATLPAAYQEAPAQIVVTGRLGWKKATGLPEGEAGLFRRRITQTVLAAQRLRRGATAQGREASVTAAFFPKPESLKPREPISLPASKEGPGLTDDFNGLHFARQEGSLGKGLKAPLDPANEIALAEAKQWGTEGDVPKKERLYAYAPDGAGPPLGYFKAGKEGKVTWVQTSERAADLSLSTDYKGLRFVKRTGSVREALQTPLDHANEFRLPNARQMVADGEVSKKERLYAYAPDGAGPPLGYFKVKNGKVTWFQASDRSAVQNLQTAAGTVGLFGLAGTSAFVYDRISGL